MDENLVKFKDDFYKECNTINFFLKLLDEIHMQIKFFEYICEEDFKIVSERAENGLNYLKKFKKELKKLKDEPSNLFLIENQLIKFLYLYYSSFNTKYPHFESSIKKNISPIKENIESIKKNILNLSISKLKQIQKTKKRKDLNEYMEETLELMMITTFKSFFKFYQIILISAKQKNNLYQSIKVKTEEMFKSEEINVIINELSERSYALKYKINYIPLHFGNNIYKELLNDESNDIVELSKSYLDYTFVFNKCIQIRKKLIKELRIFFDVIQKKEKKQIERLKKVCGKITLQTKSLSYSSQGIINSWNLVFSSWNSIYTNFVNYMQFFEEIWNPKLIKIINECDEEYKTFEKRWEDYSEKITDLLKKYSKLSNTEENPEKLSEKKKAEEDLKNFLTIDCTNFLDNNISLLRENEIKRANDVKDLIDKIIFHTRNRFDQYLENTEQEYDNAASIELFEEVQNIFESQFDPCEIKDQENFLEKLKEKIKSIDFEDKLADSARLSLAEYYEHNDFDEGFEFTQGEIENPFGPMIKDNEESKYNFNGEKNLINSGIGKVLEEDISSIPLNEKNKDMINLNLNNYKTPNFKSLKSENENNINIKNDEENDITSDINIINNLNDKFNEQKEKKMNSFESKEENENDNKDNNELNEKDENLDNILNKDSKIEKKENEYLEAEKNKINEKDILKDKEMKYEKNNLDTEEIKIDNKNNDIKIKDKLSVYYGILGILGLFCLKSLYSTNNFFSVDSFLNLIILGIISFVFYKTQIL